MDSAVMLNKGDTRDVEINKYDDYDETFEYQNEDGTQINILGGEAEVVVEYDRLDSGDVAFTLGKTATVNGFAQVTTDNRFRWKLSRNVFDNIQNRGLYISFKYHDISEDVIETLFNGQLIIKDNNK